MNEYLKIKEKLVSNQFVWLVTGCAGFIGSNLIETLLKLDQKVVGLDNLSTGSIKNIEEVNNKVTDAQRDNFQFIEGDIRDEELCNKCLIGVNFVLHQAALGSVPRSLDDPLTTDSVNIHGFLTILNAAKNANVQSFTYAASSSTYGDHPALPKVEENIGVPLSPYAVTKYVNELYAGVFAKSYAFKTIGLRYFNVFGRRQNPNGAYAAVIPKWIYAMIKGEPIYINGDGETSRDFCYIENVVQANILAAFAEENSKDQVFNVALGDRTTLNQLFDGLKKSLSSYGIQYNDDPIHCEQRPGDVRHSQANIDKMKKILGYEPTHRISEGIAEAVKWYVEKI